MPRRTLLFRLQWETGRRIGLHKRRYKPSTLTNNDILAAFPLAQCSPEGLLDYFRSRAATRFLFDPVEVAAIRKVWSERLPAARERLLAAADRVCRHEFALLGSGTKRFPGDICWHDELGGPGRWPKVHWSKVDIRSISRVGDVKQTWELNRTQFFVTLGRAYALTGDSRYAEELAAQMRSWIEQNPSEIGVNWYSNLECAIRSTSWIFALQMTLNWPGWDAVQFTDIIRCLTDHHHHLYQHIGFSEHCNVGNHLIGEAMGLVLLSLYLPEAEHAQRYKDRGMSILLREGPLQIYEDGVNFENAISYHRFVFYMYFIVGLMLEKSGESLPDSMWQRLERMGEFAIDLRTPTGQISQVGDWDNGRTVILDESDVRDFAPMLCTMATRFGRADFKDASGGFTEECLWLLGSNAADMFDAINPAPPHELDRHYRVGGFCVWRSGWEKNAESLLFKCSPFHEHSHADNLSLLYSAHGKEWLVDRGTFTYNGAWRWRTYFRGTRAHNTVVVDGFGQALAHRTFRWLKRPKQKLHAFFAGKKFGFASGSTTGFHHLTSPVRHARSVLLVRGDYVLVLDALVGQQHHDYELLWHVAPGHSITTGRDGIAYTNDANGSNLWIQTVSTASTMHRIAHGELDPIQGWHSPLYGKKEPAPTVVYQTRAVGALILATLIRTVTVVPKDLEPSLRLEANTQSNDDCIRLTVTAPGFDDCICLPNPDRPSREGTLWLERDGKRVSIR